MPSNVIDILFRIDDICKKYDKYDLDKQRDHYANGDDAFARLYATFDSDIDAALRKAGIASEETNRAAAVAMFAEIRRTKARLIEDLPKLRKLAGKKVKGLSNEEQAIRNDLLLALPERIQAIPDGASAAARQIGGWPGSSSHKNIKFDATADEDFSSAFFKESEESSQFRTEYEMRKLKQDQGLDTISEGLDVLKNLAHDMNEEMDKQVPLMDEIETKADKATAGLKNTNVKLKETITKMRSSRNFCIDIILLCVILGIASYLYNVLR